MELGEKVHICVVGAGGAGISFVRELRKFNKKVRITIIDYRKYFFDKSDWHQLTLNKDRKKIVNLETFAKKFKVTFVQERVERVNFSRKTVFFKERVSLNAQILVFSCGLTSKTLPVKGDFRKGFFYASDIDLFSVREYLPIAQEIVIFASTFLGFKLAFYFSFIGKEIKFLTDSCDFLRENKERILLVLRERGVDIYEGASVVEVIGEQMVKAVKTSVPKVFSAQLVFADTGFLSCPGFFDFIPKKEGFDTPYPDVFVIGDAHTPFVENERVFLHNSSNARLEGEGLARFLAGHGPEPAKREIASSEEIKKFLDEQFREEDVAGR